MPSLTYKRLARDLVLIITGNLVYILGYKMIAASHSFVPSGTYGLSLLIQKFVPISVSFIYFLVNVPIFIVAKRTVSLRFFLLNLFSMVFFSVMVSQVNYTIEVQSTILAAIAAGAIMGTGTGIVLRSSGGGGGTDMLAVMLNLKFGIRIGLVFLMMNSAVMLFAATQVSTDILIASIVMVFVASTLTDDTLSLFNRRKEVKIISKKHEELVVKMLAADMYATIINGKGAYTKESTPMIMTVTNNLALKRLENLVFDVDPHAIFIVSNTFEVIGVNIAPRKNYH